MGLNVILIGLFSKNAKMLFLRPPKVNIWGWRGWASPFSPCTGWWKKRKIFDMLSNKSRELGQTNAWKSFECQLAFGITVEEKPLPAWMHSYSSDRIALKASEVWVWFSLGVCVCVCDARPSRLRCLTEHYAASPRWRTVSHVVAWTRHRWPRMAWLRSCCHAWRPRAAWLLARRLPASPAAPPQGLHRQPPTPNSATRCPLSSACCPHCAAAPRSSLM